MRLALLLAAGAALALAVAFAGRILVVADPLPRSADAIVVLAGSIPDRVLEAADLYHSGIAPIVVVTRERDRPADVVLRRRGVDLPASDVLTLAALERLGVPARATVRLRRRAFSTASEARTIARWACRKGLRQLVVVTSRPHTRRARLILRRALGPDVQVAVRPSRYDTFSAGRWWRIRHHAKVVLREYQQLAHHWLRERWLIEPCGGLRRRPVPARPRSGGALDGGAQQRRQLAARVHLAHDVAAADELPVHVHLRDRRPVGVGLDRLALLGLGQDVDRLEGDADLGENADGRGGEAAHREPRRALHVDHDPVLPDLALDLLEHIGLRVGHREPPRL
jgi:uncharacterized SAM-binding protein YcdF (DUF218 family)